MPLYNTPRLTGSTGVGTAPTYEEGAWTPVFEVVTPNDFAATWSISNGRYRKIGNVVIAQFALTSSSFTHSTASGAVNISGLPFPNVNTNSIAPCGIWTIVQGVTKANYTHFGMSANNNTSLFGITANGSGQTGTNLAIGDFPSGGSVILRGTFIYNAA